MVLIRIEQNEQHNNTFVLNVFKARKEKKNRSKKMHEPKTTNKIIMINTIMAYQMRPKSEQKKNDKKIV